MGRGSADDGIELLAPNTGAFGVGGDLLLVDDDGVDDAAFDDEPRPRWTMAVAGLLVTGLLAGGILAAAPWSDDTSATPPTTTSPDTTTTTDVAPRTTVPHDPLAGVPTEPAGWVIGTGGFWEFGGASSYGDMGGTVDTGARIDLWADRGTTRTDGGPWLSVQSQPYTDGRLIADGVRTTFGGRSGVVATDADGVTHVVVDLGVTGPTLLIDSSGLPLDQIVALAAGITPPERFDRTGAIRYGDLRTRAGVFGLPLRVSRPAGYGWTALFGVPLASSYWSQDSGSSVGVDVWSVDEPALAALPLTLDPIEIPARLQPMVDALADMGRDVEAYTTIGLRSTTVVAWRDGDRLISLTGDGPTATLAQLLVAARSARLAGDVEWRELLVQSQEGIDTGGGGQGTPAPTVLQTGVFADDGGQWDALLAEQFFWINGPNGTGSFTTIELDDQPSVQRFVSPAITVWVAVDPTGAATTMRITPVDTSVGTSVVTSVGTSVDVAMEHFVTGTAAVYPRLIDVAATVELLDASGAVVFSDGLLNDQS